MIFRAREAYFSQKQQHMPSLRDGREHLAHLREEAQMAEAQRVKTEKEVRVTLRRREAMWLSGKERRNIRL